MSDSQLLDPKKLESLKNTLDKLVKGNKPKEVETDITSYFKKLEKRFKKDRRSFERKLEAAFEEFTTYKELEYNE